MAVFTDGIGNAYLGDCIYANHNIAFTNDKFLKAAPYSNISALLTTFLTTSGLKFRNVLPQSIFNNGIPDNYSLFAYAPASDTIDDRYAIGYQGLFTNIPNGRIECSVFNDSGYVPTNNTWSDANRLLAVAANGQITTGPNTFFGNQGQFMNGGNGLADRSDITWVGVADNNSLGIFSYRYFHTPANTVRYHFHYIGRLADVNTNYNYYNNNIVTQTISLTCNSNQINGNQEVLPSQFASVVGGHYIGTTAKLTLQTGDAQYPIVCADGQTPTAQWATDFYVFDNNATLGYPAIGRVRNLLLATGSYTIGKPVRIQGNAKPDNGFNRWLPVGSYGGKVVLMRCYSSVDI